MIRGQKAKQRNYEVLQSGFNKAMESYKLKTTSKGRVEENYQNLDFNPPLVYSLYTIAKDDDQVTEVGDEVETDLPNYRIIDLLAPFYLIYFSLILFSLKQKVTPSQVKNSLGPF